MVLFTAPAGEISQWARAEPRDHTTTTGAQRISRPYKVKSVTSFFRADPRNVIPTAITVAFRQGTSRVSGGQIFTPEGEVKGVIVDGQHRLAGAVQFSSDLLLPVVGLLDVGDDEIAFQFLVINNKASKVAPNHMRTLALEYDEVGLADRLAKVKVQVSSQLEFVGLANKNDESPFRGILDLSTTPPDSKWVAPAAIEESFRVISGFNVKELNEDPELMTDLFFTIWKSIKTKWHDIWVKPSEQSKLLQKVSIVTLTAFVSKHIIAKFDMQEIDLFEPDQVAACADKVLGMLNKSFWTVPWNKTGLDTTAGRKILSDSLEQLMRNHRDADWKSGISLLD